MSTVIAGHFQLQDEVDQARSELLGAGFREGQISAFFVNQPGQHDLTPIGGDHQVSAGAKETPIGVLEGAAAGGVVGVALGAATAVVTGPVGPIVGGLVGAHVGSLFSFSKMKEGGEAEQGGENQLEPRKPGMLVAVAVDDAAGEQRALEVLRDLGAHHLERAEGSIVGGDWVDFDPLSMPAIIA
ncbi:MAG: hypothetical protein QFF03_19220 [Pseudomonadota bacterium]|nr:hypothetical protein [Pseudomonadota bacterium]